MADENTETTITETVTADNNKVVDTVSADDVTAGEGGDAEVTATKETDTKTKKEAKTVPLARFLKQNNELQTARQKTAELEALLANGGKTTETKALTAEDIDRVANEKADKIAAINKFNEKSNDIYASGVKEYTKAEFENAIDTIKTVGLIPTDMIDVLADLGDGHKMLKYLADDLDKTETLFSLTPTKRAIELTKLHSKVTAPVIKKQISNAPAPVNPITGAVNPPAVDIYDKKQSTSDRIKEMQRQQQVAREKKYGKR